MIEDHFGTYLVLIPHCMTEILAKECKSGKSTVLALGTVVAFFLPPATRAGVLEPLQKWVGHVCNPGAPPIFSMALIRLRLPEGAEERPDYA